MIHLNPTLNRRALIIGIVLSFLLPVASLIIPTLVYSYAVHSSVNFKTMFFVSRLWLWLCLLIMYGYSVKAEKQSFLLREEKKYSPGFYIISIVLLVVILFVLAVILNIVYKLTGVSSAKSEKLLQVLQLFNNNRSLMFFTVLTAGIMEELMFRGYLLSRLELLFKNRYLPVIISSVLFGLIHFGYGTVQNIVTPIFIGMVFALYYTRFQTIVVPIIAHFLYDLLIMLISMRYYFPNHT